MPAPIRILLSEAEDLALSELRVNSSVPQRTRDRAHMVRLNAQGWNVPAIADIFTCHEHTVRATLRRWQTHGIAGLSDAPGRGIKARWSEADIQHLEQALEKEPRTYNSAQLAQKLEQDRQVKLSSDQLRRILKKRATGGSGLAIATSRSKTQMNEPLGRLT